ncbi:MAG: dTMP kinase, partial [Acholeplasmataceae bacterium]|nr:dTMP kinase [Acholeplasmataceae bacterium]
NVDMSPKTEALLFAASRIQHLEEIILPALNDNKVVLCDRYIDSSLAYQGYARGLGLEAILKANNFVLGHMPNYTVYIDVDPKIGLNRAHSRGMANRLDNETLAFHQKVREGYLLISQTYKERFIIVDGNCDMKTLVERTITKLKDVLKW